MTRRSLPGAELRAAVRQRTRPRWLGARSDPTLNTSRAICVQTVTLLNAFPAPFPALKVTPSKRNSSLHSALFFFLSFFWVLLLQTHRSRALTLRRGSGGHSTVAAPTAQRQLGAPPDLKSVHKSWEQMCLPTGRGLFKLLSS